MVLPGQPTTRRVAVAGLINPAGEILLVQTRRLPDMWQPVGGGIEEGESPNHAIVREIQEELNATVDPSESVFNFQTSYDFGEGTVNFYTFNVSDTRVSDFSIDESEVLHARWFTIEEALKLPCYPATAKYLQSYREQAQ